MSEQTLHSRLNFKIVLKNKLDHPDLYVKTPETDELGTIDNIKKRIRSNQYESDTILHDLNRQSITVMCQLVKDFFLDKKEKLLIGGGPDFENMLQAVRCCNDQYLMTMIKSMEADKQSQLGFWRTKLIWFNFRY